jgi:hypothetical protein
VEHLVFAFHLYSFTLLWNIAIWPLFYALGGIDPFGKTLWVTVLTFTVGAIYVYKALQRVYQDSAGTNLYRSILVLVGAQICFGVTVSIAILAALVAILR